MNKYLVVCLLLIQSIQMIAMEESEIFKNEKKRQDIVEIFAMDEDISYSSQDAFFEAIKNQASDLQDIKKDQIDKNRKRESVSRVLAKRKGHLLKHDLNKNDLNRSEPLPKTEKTELNSDSNAFFKSYSADFARFQQGCCPVSKYPLLLKETKLISKKCSPEKRYELISARVKCAEERGLLQSRDDLSKVNL